MRLRIEKLAIANRGEVAVRIIRACEELNIETVLLHSDVDESSLAFRISDEQVCVGSSAASESYLNIESNIQGALTAGADAIHPGFGFLSENPDFADACKSNRLIFVGPTAESIKLFGNKISAKKLVHNTGCPTIPGYEGENQDVDYLVNKCEEIGFPVMVKVSSGGGGRGLRVITDRASAIPGIESAKREGLAAFGSDIVFLEKYMDRAKHIEVQIFGDASGVIHHLFERDCSVQRRHQKIIEESPCSQLSLELRKKLIDAATEIAHTANYKGAGTVEFLVQDERFYFLEMNTRLQVEHTVSEMVTGVDLVKAQIITAEDRGLLWTQDELNCTGHAIECRICAEDPYKNAMPSIGKIESCHWPMGPGRRFEIGFEAGDEISEYYDSMIAKVVVWDESRPRAIEKMKATLKEIVIFGLKTNIPYLLEILGHATFSSGQMNTNFINQNFPDGLKSAGITKTQQKIIELAEQHLAGTEVSPGKDQFHKNPWRNLWEKKS